MLNRADVEDERQDVLAAGSHHHCHYSPRTILSTGAFFHRHIPWSLALHAVAWPGLSVVAAVTMCAYIYCTRKRSRGRYDVRSSSAAAAAVGESRSTRSARRRQKTLIYRHPIGTSGAPAPLDVDDEEVVSEELLGAESPDGFIDHGLVDSQ